MPCHHIAAEDTTTHVSFTISFHVYAQRAFPLSSVAGQKALTPNSVICDISPRATAVECSPHDASVNAPTDGNSQAYANRYPQICHFHCLACYGTSTLFALFHSFFPLFPFPLQKGEMEKRVW
jgi:hypothetical protein